MCNYTIEQFVKHSSQFETMPEGEFETEEAAIKAMQDLVETCGFSNMRVVDSDGDVVAES